MKQIQDFYVAVITTIKIRVFQGNFQRWLCIDVINATNTTWQSDTFRVVWDGKIKTKTYVLRPKQPITLSHESGQSQQAMTTAK